jgi:hypothetical protein
MKKMLLKDKDYSEVNDKVGVRGVVHFLSDLILKIRNYNGSRIKKCRMAIEL